MRECVWLRRSLGLGSGLAAGFDMQQMEPCSLEPALTATLPRQQPLLAAYLPGTHNSILMPFQ